MRCFTALLLIISAKAFSADAPPILWARVHFPGFPISNVTFTSAVGTSDGQIAGTASGLGFPGAPFFKFDQDGNLLFTAASAGFFFEAHKLVETADQRLITTGMGMDSTTDDSQLMLGSFSCSGPEYWSTAWNPTDGMETGMDLCELPDGGAAACGISSLSPDSGESGILIRTGPGGQVTWTAEWGSGDEKRRFISLLYHDEVLLVLGSRQTGPGQPVEPYLLSYDTGGDLLWENHLASLAGRTPADMCEAADGGLLIALSGPLLAHTDHTGQPDWTITPPGAGNHQLRSVSPAFDGSFILAGDCHVQGGSPERFGMISLHSGDEGQVIWADSVTELGCEELHFADQLPDGGYIAGGNTEYADGSALLIRYGSNQGTAQDGTPGSFELTALTPNPASAGISLIFQAEEAQQARFTLTDLSGRTVFTGPWHRCSAGSNSMTLTLPNALPSGCYIASLGTEADAAARLVTVLR